MNTLEAILSRLFPVRLPRIDGVIMEREPHPLIAQHPPLREGEDGIVGPVREGTPKMFFRDGIERMRFEADYAEFLAERLEEAQ